MRTELLRDYRRLSQVSDEQVQAMTGRMKAWLDDHTLLVEDNRNSLRWRMTLKERGGGKVIP